MFHTANVGTGTAAGPILPGVTGHDVTGDSLQLRHVGQATSGSCIEGVAGLLRHLCHVVGAEGGGGVGTQGACLGSLCWPAQHVP